MKKIKNDFLRRIGGSKRVKGALAIIAVLTFISPVVFAGYSRLSSIVDHYLETKNAKRADSDFKDAYSKWEKSHESISPYKELEGPLNAITETNSKVNTCLDNRDYVGIGALVTSQDTNIAEADAGTNRLLKQIKDESNLIHILDEKSQQLVGKKYSIATKLCGFVRDENLLNKEMCDITLEYLSIEKRMDSLLKDFVSGQHDANMTAVLVYDLVDEKDKIFEKRGETEKELTRKSAQLKDEWQKLKALLE